MQGRSWMAALTLTAGLLSVQAASARSEDELPQNKVKLVLQIRGLSRQGCEVDIKPGHQGCEFRPITKHIDYRDVAVVIVFDDVKTKNADRDCAFAITIREPGQEARTVRRGLRISERRTTTATVPVLNCFLNSPSRIAQAESNRERR